jgi:hypothetical protein
MQSAADIHEHFPLVASKMQLNKILSLHIALQDRLRYVSVSVKCSHLLVNSR